MSGFLQPRPKAVAPTGIDPHDIYHPASELIKSLPVQNLSINSTSDKHTSSASDYQLLNQHYVDKSIPNEVETQSSFISKEAKGCIYSAIYSGITVYEMMCRTVAVMRRKSDSFVNATQILKVAGIDKGRRTKILEREILQGVHEKGGYGKYQGTWIPFDRGMVLAEEYGVSDVLSPLLNYAPGDDDTPTKEMMKISKEPIKSNFATRKVASRKSSNFPSYRHIEDDSDEYPDTKKQKITQQLQNQTAPFFLNEASNTIIEHISNQDPLNYFYNQPYAEEPCNISQIAHQDLLYQIRSSNEYPSERHRSTIMAMFMAEDETLIPDILLPHIQTPSDFDVNLILDDQGHTAFHWAAALGRISLLNLLLLKGANGNLLNWNGESPLIRSVMVSNNYEKLSFPTLLEIVCEQLSISDKKNRNVIHHICLSTSLKAGAQSCRYYMECLLDYVSRTLDPTDSECLVNQLDVCGDTPINIAARLGNRHLVDQLLKFGADAYIPNRVGLRSVDFGNQLPLQKNPVKETETTMPPHRIVEEHHTRIIYPSIQADEESVVTIHDANLFDLEGEGYEPNNASFEIIRETQSQIKDMSRELSKVRKQNLAYRNQLISNEQELKDRVGIFTINEVSNAELLQCKMIISACCKIPLESIDSLIGPLLESIQSDCEVGSSENLTKTLLMSSYNDRARKASD